MFTGIELLIYSDQFGLISICSIPILCRMFIFLFVLEEKKCKQILHLVILSKCSKEESWFWQYVFEHVYRTTPPHILL